MTRTWLSSAVVAALGVAAACGGNPKPQTKPAAAPSQRTPSSSASDTPAPPTTAPDPVAALIEASQRQFDIGEQEVNAGHLDRARLAFDQAIQVLLDSPYGARTDARLREHFDRLVDRINAFEVTALAEAGAKYVTSYKIGRGSGRERRFRAV
jgi:membrane-bound lytic murein transglycosylase D